MQLNSLCLHAKERKSLESFVHHTPHALLLTAEAGFGKSTIAHRMADDITGNSKHFQLVVEPLPDTHSITIDQARQLKSFFTLKTNASSSKRVVIILDADLMTIEAQNSLLKLLEEPPANCYMLLTSSRPQRLLSTIRSRVTTHALTSPSRDEMVNYLKLEGFSEADITHAMSLGGRLVGLVVSILKKENSIIADSVVRAKELLSMTTLERLKQVDKLAKNKPVAQSSIEGIKIVAEAVIINSLHSGKESKKWAGILDLANNSLSQLEKNLSTKLVLTNLFLQM